MVDVIVSNQSSFDHQLWLIRGPWELKLGPRRGFDLSVLTGKRDAAQVPDSAMSACKSNHVHKCDDGDDENDLDVDDSYHDEDDNHQHER